MDRFGPGGAGPEGTISRAILTIGDHSFMVFDSPPVHAFTFTPSISIFLNFDNEAELDQVWAALIDGGAALMPPGNYGFARRYGWPNDKFGVSWQLNLL